MPERASTCAWTASPDTRTVTAGRGWPRSLIRAGSARPAPCPSTGKRPPWQMAWRHWVDDTARDFTALARLGGTDTQRNHRPRHPSRSTYLALAERPWPVRGGRHPGHQRPAGDEPWIDAGFATEDGLPGQRRRSGRIRNHIRRGHCDHRYGSGGQPGQSSVLLMQKITPVFPCPRGLTSRPRCSLAEGAGSGSTVTGPRHEIPRGQYHGSTARGLLTWRRDFAVRVGAVTPKP